MIVIPQYDLIYSNEGENGRRVIKKDKKGFIDLEGNIVVKPKFDEFRFSGIDSLIIVREYDKYGVFNMTIDSFFGKWGIISETGAFLIIPKFDLIHDIKRDRVNARLHGETFPINYKGQIIVDESLEQKQ